MGATVTTGKLACAFQSTLGNTMYVLFEETYEKNCHPHSPHWSCQYIGDLEGAMKLVFLAASACEGGMLQNRNGHITPEGYIGKWLAELADPVHYPNETVDLRLGSNFYATVPQEQFAAVMNCLAAIGNTTLSPRLSEGQTVSLSLYDDAELLATLYGRGPLSAWRVFRSIPSAPRNKSLGYAPAKASNINVPFNLFLKLDDYERLKQIGDGIWKHVGWEYSAVGSYIAQYYKTELLEPGSYAKRIKAYRNQIEAASEMPEGMKVLVDTTITISEKYQRQLVDEVPTKFNAKPIDVGYEIDVTPGVDFYHLKSLPALCTTWISPPSYSSQNGSQQGSMF